MKILKYLIGSVALCASALNVYSNLIQEKSLIDSRLPGMWVSDNCVNLEGGGSDHYFFTYSETSKNNGTTTVERDFRRRKLYR